MCVIPEKNYMQDQDVRSYYDRWVKSPTLFDHRRDRERFFKFVKACINYVGKGNTFKKLDIDTLKLHLDDDLAKLRRENYEAYDNTKHEIVSLFQTLLEYEDTELP